MDKMGYIMMKQKMALGKSFINPFFGKELGQCSYRVNSIFSNIYLNYVVINAILIGIWENEYVYLLRIKKNNHCENIFATVAKYCGTSGDISPQRGEFCEPEINYTKSPQYNGSVCIYFCEIVELKLNNVVINNDSDYDILYSDNNIYRQVIYVEIKHESYSNVDDPHSILIFNNLEKTGVEFIHSDNTKICGPLGRPTSINVRSFIPLTRHYNYSYCLFKKGDTECVLHYDDLKKRIQINNLELKFTPAGNLENDSCFIHEINSHCIFDDYLFQNSLHMGHILEMSEKFTVEWMISLYMRKIISNFFNERNEHLGVVTMFFIDILDKYILRGSELAAKLILIILNDILLSKECENINYASETLCEGYEESMLEHLPILMLKSVLYEDTLLKMRQNASELDIYFK